MNLDGEISYHQNLHAQHYTAAGQHIAHLIYSLVATVITRSWSEKFSGQPMQFDFGIRGCNSLVGPCHAWRGRNPVHATNGKQKFINQRVN